MKEINKYIKNIDRVEFTLTNNCNGRCKHCSEGVLPGGCVLDANKAALALETLSKHYNIQSVMTFGGEALLYPEVVYTIHKKAKKCSIENRQLITNGCFSKNTDKIREVACKLQENGVNDILLSVDCFHAEHLPLEYVRSFAISLIENYKGRFRLQPTWVRDRNENNKYNVKTRECLNYFSDLNIEIHSGDIIFPEGNAAVYLAEYFEKKPIDLDFKCGQALYTTKLDEISCLTFDSNGDVIPCSFPMGNIYNDDIISIIKSYAPYSNPFSRALLENGICGLIELAKKENIDFNLDKHYSPCGVCNEIAQSMLKKIKAKSE